VKLVSKSGGKSGVYVATAPKARAALKSVSRKPETIRNEVAAPRMTDTSAQREAFRAFMTANRLRATEWAKLANVPAAQIYAYLTGKTRTLTPDVVSRLARAARVREEDMFRA
jgi:predicted transcriptional regulator